MKLPKELTTVTRLSKSLAVIVFLAFPFIGFFLGLRFQEMLYLAKGQEMEENLSIPRVPTSTPIAIPTVDPSITANWKTYTNTKYGFQLKYPNEWKSSGEQNGRVGPLQETYTTSINFTLDNEITLFLSLTAGNPNFVDNDSYLNFLSGGDIVKSGLREIYVNNIKALLSTGLAVPAGERGPKYNSSGASFFNKGKTYHVEVYDSKKNGDQEQVLKLILSTFKFTDQDNIIPPQVCTQDVKLCPDGKTYVGRQGPNCEFAACHN